MARHDTSTAQHSPRDGRRRSRRWDVLGEHGGGGSSLRENFWVGWDGSGAGRLKDRRFDVMEVSSVRAGRHGPDLLMSHLKL